MIAHRGAMPPSNGRRRVVATSSKPSSTDNVMTRGHVEKMLEDNEAFAAAILEFQRQGKIAESVEYVPSCGIVLF